MNTVEQNVNLNDAVSQMDDQSISLGQDLLWGSHDLGHQHSVGVAQRNTVRVFKTELLPPAILNDPRFWETTAPEEVDLHPMLDSPAYLRPDTQVQVDLLRYRC